MTEPISSQNRSIYDPSQFGAAECDASTASCAPPAAASGAARTVTIPPVYITGDAGLGSSELVRRYESAKAPSCSAENANAAISCGLAVAGAGATAVTAPSGVALAFGVATTLGLAAQCGRDLAFAVDCNKQASP
jgi:hypothetical protein